MLLAYKCAHAKKIVGRSFVQLNGPRQVERLFFDISTKFSTLLSGYNRNECENCQKLMHFERFSKRFSEQCYSRCTQYELTEKISAASLIYKPKSNRFRDSHTQTSVRGLPDGNEFTKFISSARAAI